MKTKKVVSHLELVGVCCWATGNSSGIDLEWLAPLKIEGKNFEYDFPIEVEQVSGIPAGITWISEYLDFLYPYPYLDFQNAGIRYDKVSDQDTCTGIRHMSFSYQDTCTWVDTCPFRYQNNL